MRSPHCSAQINTAILMKTHDFIGLIWVDGWGRFLWGVCQMTLRYVREGDRREEKEVMVRERYWGMNKKENRKEWEEKVKYKEGEELERHRVEGNDKCWAGPYHWGDCATNTHTQTHIQYWPVCNQHTGPSAKHCQGFEGSERESGWGRMLERKIEG